MNSFTIRSITEKLCQEFKKVMEVAKQDITWNLINYSIKTISHNISLSFNNIIFFRKTLLFPLYMKQSTRKSKKNFTLCLINLCMFFFNILQFKVFILQVPFISVESIPQNVISQLKIFGLQPYRFACQHNKDRFRSSYCISKIIWFIC